MTTFSRVLAILSMASAVGVGAPFFVNGGPNTESGNEMTSRIQAEDFTLDSAMTLTGVRFWAFYFTDIAAGYLGTVEWAIHTDGGGQPGTALFSGLATPNVSPGATNCCNGIPALLEFVLPDISLATGTYWLALHNGPVNQTGDENFYWQTTAANATARGLEQATPFGASVWINNNLEHAFELDSATFSAGAESIPEPGTFYLAGFAMLVLALRRLF